MPHSQSVAWRKWLVPETAPFQDDHEPLQSLNMNRTQCREPTADREDDEDIMPSASCLSSPLSSRASRAATGSAQHGCSTPSSSSHAQCEQPVLPSLSHVRCEHTTPPPSNVQSEQTISPPFPQSQNLHVTPLSHLTTPSLSHFTTSSSPHSRADRELLPQPHSCAQLPVAPFCQGYNSGPKPKAADYESDVEKMLL